MSVSRDGEAKRIEDIGDIAEGRFLQAPLVDEAIGVALEIGDHDVVAGAQDLTEMKVPMHADTRPGERVVEYGGEAGEDLVAPVEHGEGAVVLAPLQVGQRLLQAP